MARSIPAPGPDAVAPPSAHLDCERLDCYRVAVQFQVLSAGLCRNRRIGSLRSQLDRASVSVVLNIAEGVGRTSGPDKAHFLAVARGSATECAAALDLLLARGLIAATDHRHDRGLLVRIVQMLTRLALRVHSRQA
jgi:four helix bundle protein